MQRWSAVVRPAYGIIALVLTTVQDRTAGEIVATDVAEALGPFDLSRQLSSNRTQGIPNMIALIRATAERYLADSAA